MENTTLKKDLDELKLKIIQNIASCKEDETDSKLLFKVAGYIECLIDKNNNS